MQCLLEGNKPTQLTTPTHVEQHHLQPRTLLLPSATVLLLGLVLSMPSFARISPAALPFPGTLPQSPARLLTTAVQR